MLQEYHWSSSDGLDHYAVDFRPARVRAAVGIIHGLGEHIRRYDHVADFLLQHDIAMLGYDRRGHGRSEGPRGHSPSFELLLEEVEILRQQLQERYPGVPHLLYGHSMGGNLLLNFLIRHRPHLTAAVVSGPHIRMAKEPHALLVTFGRLMKRLLPGYTQNNGLMTEFISRDPDVVRAYEADPLVHDRVTATMGIDMLNAASQLDSYAGDLPVPTLLMHGGDDRLTAPGGTRDFADRVSGEVELKIWPGFYHEIHNEPEQQEVLQYALQWMLKHLRD